MARLRAIGCAAVLILCCVSTSRDVLAQEPSGLAKLTTTEVKFPSMAEENVVLGGGGRYLILHFKQLRRLGIFDLKDSVLTGYVPAADDRVLFAADMTHLFVYLGGSGTMSRYRLETREREVSVPFSQEVTAIAMGHASNGPLVVVSTLRYDGQAKLYDVRTLKPLTDIRVSGNRGPAVEGAFTSGTIINVSADGQVVGGTRRGVSPGGVYLARIGQDTVEVRYEHSSWGPIRPGPNGQRIYAANGVYNVDLKPIGAQRGGLLLPEVTQGAFHLKLASQSYGETPKLSLHMWGNEQALVNLDLAQLGLTQFPSHPVHFQNTQWHHRLFFNAALKKLVAIPDDRQRLIVAPLDVQSVLDESGLDYLFVRSQPPTRVYPGERVEYQVEVLSRRGGVKLSLEAGAEGMKLSPTGLFTWDVPASANEETVIILVTDATGQEVYHNFKLTVAATQEQGVSEPSLPQSPADQTVTRPELAPGLVRKEIRLSIDLAKLYKRSERDDLAILLLEQLTERYPAHPDVADARALLAEWRVQRD